jgi:hypothetical protein
MNAKIIFPAALGALLTLFCAGCASNETIPFASEAKLPEFASATPDHVAKSLAKADEDKIDEVIFSYLLERHFWEDGDYSAIFLQATDNVVERMQKKFSTHKPAIKASYHLDLRDNLAPRDKDTGKPVMILGVDANDPDADDSVAAIGRWFAGTAVQGFYTFTLKKSGSDWVITEVR